MTSLRDILKLIRPINALIVFATLMVVRLILFQYYNPFKIQPSIDAADYFLMMVTGMLILGAGNVINDIIDVDIDRLNKPRKALIPRRVSIRLAWVVYFSLNILALIFSVYLILKYQVGWYIFMPFCAILLLYVYSRWLKKKFFIGNLVIALLCGVLGLVGFWVEMDNIHTIKELSDKDYTMILYSAGSIFIFSFLLVLARELIKDCEDMVGDRSAGATTIPIKLGLVRSDRLIMFLWVLYGVVFLALSIARYKLYESTPMMIAIIIYLIIYVLSIRWIMVRFADKNLYSRLSTLVKIFLILGLIFILIK
ncbi:MAG TPA: UbiA family prenyltransferase [Saprospiraceae bacterium]|nr:UbiA family prenyltransferase [Saprospiraceae bacterium]MBX7180088.1 UbiA family prenyltransferase [Saprospiraceae bacterium]MCB0591427.1 UbiA family prenyltransferase [Saprospiraceae bacterium]MCO5283658.1 UbiA family prenyltransferase [Saprospiraceae bacterium]MCO6469457.1 UbiA family prenyltransferase [Saprospiraceae bacterium]